MAKIGYARVSSIGQNLDRQLEQLKDCDKIFTEKVSGKNIDRPELQSMMQYVREGDSVVCTSLSRLGRSTRDLLTIIDQLKEKKVEIVFQIQL